jgi:tRNA (guanine37-N1)-methyltransferase
MNFIVLTIFPKMFDPFWEHGIIRKAIEQRKISVSAIDIRDFATGKHPARMTGHMAGAVEWS